MRKKAVFQGFFAFVLGGIVTAVVIANQPQLLDDVRLAMQGVRFGAQHLVRTDNSDSDVTASLARRFENRGSDGYDDWRGERGANDRYPVTRRDDNAEGYSPSTGDYNRYGADYPHDR